MCLHLQLFQCPSAPTSLHKRRVLGSERVLRFVVYFFESFFRRSRKGKRWCSTSSARFFPCGVGPRNPFERTSLRPIISGQTTKTVCFTRTYRHVRMCLGTTPFRKKIFVNKYIHTYIHTDIHTYITLANSIIISPTHPQVNPSQFQATPTQPQVNPETSPRCHLHSRCR